MRVKQTIYIILLLGLFIPAGAQQTPVFNLATMNPYIENPAFAGIQPYTQTFVHYRKQWIDIDGAPESALVTVDWPFKNEKHGLGIMFNTDRTNIVGHFGILASYRHTVMFAGDQSLSMGLSMGIHHNTIYFDKVQATESQESSLFNYFESASAANANFGARYVFKDIELGISANNLLNTKLQYQDENERKMLYYQYVPHFMLHTSYTYHIGSDWKLRPIVRVRNSLGMPMEPEAEVNATYQDKYQAGMVYRNNNAMAVHFSINVYDRLSVGYAFEFPVGEMTGYAGGSHEIALSYRFTGVGNGDSPANSKQLDEIIELTKKQIEKNENQEKKFDEIKEELDKSQEELKKGKQEIEKLKQMLEAERETYTEAREEDETKIEELTEDLFIDEDEPIYIILGVFEDLNVAKKYQNVLTREEGLRTEVLKRADNDQYMVTVHRKFDNKNDLKRELIKWNKVVRDYFDTEIWIYVNK